MSDMAGFFLEQVCDAEIERAEQYYNDPFSVEQPIPELELGCFDAASLDKEIAHQQIVLDAMCQSYFDDISSGERDLKSLRESCIKYTRRWQMIAGMATTVWKNNKCLSEKQKAWMETNHKGGWRKFVEELQSDKGDLFMWGIVKFSKFVEYFGEGWTLERAIKEADKKADSFVMYSHHHLECN